MAALTLPDAHSYLSSFQLLSRDFETLAEYIEPADANLGTYSHRTYELLLRACTEFESLCKEALALTSYVKPGGGNLTVLDYRTLEPTLKVEQLQVGIRIWRPSPAHVRPFANWSAQPAPQPVLPWYSAYNHVKHNRRANFAEASLNNLRHAIGAVFLMLSAFGAIEEGLREHWMDFGNEPAGTDESWYTGFIFSVVRPRVYPPPPAAST